MTTPHTNKGHRNAECPFSLAALRAAVTPMTYGRLPDGRRYTRVKGPRCERPSRSRSTEQLEGRRPADRRILARPALAVSHSGVRGVARVADERRSAWAKGISAPPAMPRSTPAMNVYRLLIEMRSSRMPLAELCTVQLLDRGRHSAACSPTRIGGNPDHVIWPAPGIQYCTCTASSPSAADPRTSRSQASGRRERERWENWPRRGIARLEIRYRRYWSDAL